ncbi:Hypothetical predicted protein [Mytilus galloprovincialis]|uniref:HTH CENPB-type domain-containing protein n=1 Tax=Mytilus galloprovincialis TaxID=29158 RepID=A0A8B6H465_MYTGA|nr:Hypothetical predicted protein [Mytilus galloprovincialis]
MAAYMSNLRRISKWLERKKGWTPKQGKWSKEGLKEAVRHVKSGGMSKLKKASNSKLYNIPRTTLLRTLKTMDLDSPATKPTVLAIKDEEALVGHILRMEERGFGLTITDVRKLAYEIAVRSGRKHCFNNDKKSAGYDWWQGFRDRHPCLSVRIPEGLSAARKFNAESKCHFSLLSKAWKFSWIN